MSENQYNTNQQPTSPYPYYYYPQTSPAYYPAYYRQMPAQMPPTQQQDVNLQGMLPMEQSYIENILRLNRGKVATVYMTFENNPEWNAKIFKGRIEAAGRDHIILSDHETGKRYLLLMVYLDYVIFDEEINYSYPYETSNHLSSYKPR